MWMLPKLPPRCPSLYVWVYWFGGRGRALLGDVDAAYCIPCELLCCVWLAARVFEAAVRRGRMGLPGCAAPGVDEELGCAVAAACGGAKHWYGWCG